jgi:uncharacterized protein YqhQ
MARFSYGGQALIEGVLMRGRDAIAVALRHPDGRILWADERLEIGFRGTRWARLPLIRGLVVLYETLVVGTRWLLRAASVAAVEVPSDPSPRLLGGPAEREADGAPADVAEHPATPASGSAAEANPGAAANAAAATAAAATAADDTVIADVTSQPQAAVAAGEAPTAEFDSAEPVSAAPRPETSATVAPDTAEFGKGTVALMLGITLVVGVGLFFFVPLALARFIAGSQPPIVERAVEGAIQVTIFLGYLALIGRTPDVRRTFQYHGAEHMTIHALEAGDPLTVDAVRPYPTAHPRCGTEFLVVVILVSIVTFSLVGRLDLIWMILSRIVLIPVIAAISYEMLRFGARHRSNRFVRWIFQPGIWVQMITTKRPTDDMIEVAIVSMEQALLADGEPLPSGSGLIRRAPLSLGTAASQAAAPEA